MHLGLSRALKMPHWGIFSGRDVPLAYGLAVTAAGGGHLRSKPFSSPMVHKRQFPQKQAIKNTPQLRARYFVVHHVGTNPNTFVYPGGIGIIRLLTRK